MFFASMKNSIIFFALLTSLVCFSENVSAQCGYRMSRKHANYFASSVGYNGSGFLPMINTSDMKRLLKGNLHDYYENDVPTCSYCQDPSVLRSYGNCLALCNAYNYYNNLLTSEYETSNRYMDYEIQRMKTKRNGY